MSNDRIRLGTLTQGLTENLDKIIASAIPAADKRNQLLGLSASFAQLAAQKKLDYQTLEQTATKLTENMKATCTVDGTSWTKFRTGDMFQYVAKSFIGLGGDRLVAAVPDLVVKNGAGGVTEASIAQTAGVQRHQADSARTR